MKSTLTQHLETGSHIARELKTQTCLAFKKTRNLRRDEDSGKRMNEVEL